MNHQIDEHTKTLWRNTMKAREKKKKKKKYFP